jgi:DNA repair protein RadD
MLRDYQNKTISQLFAAIREGDKRCLVVLSCGAGKSTIFSAVCKMAHEKDRKVLFVVHRKKLVHQFKERLQNQFDINSGLIIAGSKENRRRSIQVASIQSLVGRDFPEADLIIFDEAHHIKSNQFMKVVDHYSDKVLVGLTATPERLDGSGLGDVFDRIINPIKMWELIKQGFLCETKVIVPKRKVDLSNVHMRAGEFIEKEMYDAFNSVTAYSDVVEMYKEYTPGKRMIIFNVNVQHSKTMSEYFNKAGIPAVHIDGETPDEEREASLKMVEDGKVLVLCNVAVFIEGLDVPMIEVCCLNRATNSKTVYVQTIGRAQRPGKGKDYAIVFDFGENTKRHYFVEDYDQQEFELKKSKAKKKGEYKPEPKECPECGTMNRPNARICTNCNAEFKYVKEKVVLTSGIQMEVLSREALLIEGMVNMGFGRLKELPYGKLLLAEKVRGYKKGWAVNVAKDRDEKWKQCSWDQIVNFLESEEEKIGLTDIRKQVQKESQLKLKLA